MRYMQLLDILCIIMLFYTSEHTLEHYASTLSWAFPAGHAASGYYTGRRLLHVDGKVSIPMWEILPAVARQSSINTVTASPTYYRIARTSGHPLSRRTM
ncbi:hypothetical protein FN846DRAFT_544076 [Sphaerosporella brunnea]|uniref:Secreted protein n=1 Tax=Sphaerosporella brunnea TaxID=1250544 RepID=A0A5J5F386_9PEZI|nr:hypothetical protein FN846DRAFT_544076 [Sphaerosporella brunnea]